MVYAAFELLVPLQEDNSLGFHRFAFICRAKGNAKAMRKLVKDKGGMKQGWAVAFGNNKVGEASFFSLR